MCHQISGNKVSVLPRWFAPLTPFLIRSPMFRFRNSEIQNWVLRPRNVWGNDRDDRRRMKYILGAARKVLTESPTSQAQERAVRATQSTVTPPWVLFDLPTCCISYFPAVLPWTHSQRIRQVKPVFPDYLKK